jgi:hypothetical protein
MNTDDHTTRAAECVPDSVEALQDFMDEKVRIEGGINPAREHELDALLRSLQGVQNIAVVGDDVTITYDPTQITSKELHRRMKGAGFVLEKTEVATSTPSVAH